ncbi:hypothetical protein BG003_005492 [Podila horticola]|nr:hypothetical protein BG003_005492 [Podila horticola]
MSKAAQKTGEGKFVLKRSKSEGYDSAHNEYESDSEVNVLASGSGNEYVPQDDGELSRSSKVLLKTHVAQERTGGEQGSSVQSSGDCSGHQINATSTDDAKCDTATHSTTSSLKSLSKKNSGRFTDNNHNSKNNRNSSSSGRTKLNSSNTFKTAKLDKSKTLKHDKTWMTSTSQDAKVPSIIGGNTQSEELPDFTDPEVWPRNKLLRSSTSTQAVQRELQSNLCTKLAKDLGIDTNTIQQIGRLSGAEELDALDLNLNFPARIAPNGVDILGTVAMAGFHNTQYDIERDHVIPPKSLQQRIFPGIENQYGWMEPEEWRAHCDRVMMSPTAFLGLEGTSGTEMKRRLDAVQESEEAYQDVAKLQLMHLLLWLRRVVLQDAALFNRDRFSPWIVKDPIFHSADFNKFQAELLAKMGSDGEENSIDVKEQEDSPIQDIPGMDTNSEYSDHDTTDEHSDHNTNSDLSDSSSSASSSTESDDARSGTLDETVMQQQTQSDQAQVQLQIRQLQERLDQQEQLWQQQEQCLQNQTTLLRNVLEQQSSLESQMERFQTQIQNQIRSMQAELMARQDLQFSTLAVLLQGVTAARSSPSNPPVASNDIHTKESTNAGTPPISKAVNNLAVTTAPTPVYRE